MYWHMMVRTRRAARQLVKRLGQRFESARRFFSADLQEKRKAMILPNLTWGPAYGNPFDTGCSVQHWRSDHGRMSPESLRALGLCMVG
jgi:hypothetical protein